MLSNFKYHQFESDQIFRYKAFEIITFFIITRELWSENFVWKVRRKSLDWGMRWAKDEMKVTGRLDSKIEKVYSFDNKKWSHLTKMMIFFQPIIHYKRICSKSLNLKFKLVCLIFSCQISNAGAPRHAHLVFVIEDLKCQHLVGTVFQVHEKLSPRRWIGSGLELLVLQVILFVEGHF